MKAFLKAIGYATVLALPGHWIAPAYQTLLFGLTSLVLGVELRPPADGSVDLSAANLLSVFVALCLATATIPWRQRFRSIAWGLPVLVAVECLTGVASMMLAQSPTAAGVAGVDWHAVPERLLEITRWLTVPLVWGVLLGRRAWSRIPATDAAVHSGAPAS